MSVINYSKDEDIESGDVVVSWDGLQVGDTGQPFPCRGLRLVAVMGCPSASSQTSNFAGSIEVTPSVFVPFTAGISGDYLTALSNENWWLTAMFPRVVSGSPAPQNFRALFRRR